MWLLLLVGGLSISSAAESSADAVKRSADQSVARLDKVYTLFVDLVAKMRERKDITAVNCLLLKRDLCEAMLKSAQRVKVSWLEAFYRKDQVTQVAYQTRMQSYVDSSVELRNSIPDCIKDHSLLAALGLILEQEALEPSDVDNTQEHPYQWHGRPGAEGFPPVNPASRYN